jgi:hypothetical protein
VKEYIFNGSSSPVSVFYTKKNQKSSNNRPKLQRVQAINDEFLDWFVKNQVVQEVETLHQMFILWVNGIEK